jgi:uncharacterized protein YcbX
MQISSLGSSPLKGARHSEREALEFALDGPVGDREFAVVDLANRRVLKTVENPALLACAATWVDGVLSITVDGEELAAVPQPVGGEIELDYWGRLSVVRVVDGPWMPRLTSLLGRDVALVRAARPGAVVYGDSVTLVTTDSLRLLAETVGHDVPASRFRATAVVDAGDDAHVEDSWAGRDLVLGGATVRVAAGIARCAVIDFEPDTGESGTRLLKALAGYRLRAGDIDFGVYATVVSPGTVRRGDPVRLLDR